MDISEQDIDLTELKDALLNHICINDRVFFKSQQINENELKYEERLNIAENLLNASHSRFLSRYGTNILKEHLHFFEMQQYEEDLGQIIREQLKHIRWNLDHQNTLIKNRRYSAMLKLIEEKKYFSESEMKSRDPLLFEQLVGQYYTPEEKRMRGRPDAKTDSLVDVLLQGIDETHNRDKEKEQRLNEENYVDENSSHSAHLDSDMESNHEQQWGNFENAEQKEPLKKTKKRNFSYITAAERDLLYEEFLQTMYSNFLSGKDKEFFDYTEVDTNSNYDEVPEKEQDCEDKYFESDNSSDRCDSELKNENSSQSEDELDIYMKHIENHIKRQNDEKFREEFDDE